MRESDIAWAAGLFEGEGSLCSHHVDGRPFLSASIEMRDKDIVERFVAIIRAEGNGSKARLKTRWRGNANHSRLYSWATAGTHAEHLYSLLRPYLGERRRRQGDSVIRARGALVAAQTIERICIGCGTTFITNPRTFARKTWCNSDCYHRTMGKTEHSRQLARARDRRYKARKRAGAIPGTSPHQARITR